MADIDLEELKRLVAEADDAGDDVDPSIYTAMRNALPELIARVERAERERDRLREALKDIDYGCGMLNQPAALNIPEEAWLRKRIARYENVARAALTGDTPNV